MVFSLSASEVEKKVAQTIQGSEALYEAVGLFLVNFGHAEHQLTRVFAHVLGYQNFEQFDFLAKGMELRAKCQNLQKASKLYHPMGQNIAPRISYFGDTLRKARNNFAHNDLLLRGKTVYCMSIGVTLNGRPDNVRPKGIQPPRYSLTEIRRFSLWLREFAQDLDECAVSLWNAGPFEVVAPRSSLPPANP